MTGTAATPARSGFMREAFALTLMGSAALLTLAVAGTAMVRDANERTSRERGQLDASIDRIVIGQLARRDEGRFAGAATTGQAAADAAQLPPGPEARKEAARQDRDPEERAEREARAATARPVKKRPPHVVAFRPDRALPQAFLSIRKLTFDTLR